MWGTNLKDFENLETLLPLTACVKMAILWRHVWEHWEFALSYLHAATKRLYKLELPLKWCTCSMMSDDVTELFANISEKHLIRIFKICFILMWNQFPYWMKNIWNRFRKDYDSPFWKVFLRFQNKCVNETKLSFKAKLNWNGNDIK